MNELNDTHSSNCGNMTLSAVLFIGKTQITVFHISSEEHQDIDVAILRALLQG